MDELNWEKAIEHLEEIRKLYESLPLQSGFFGLNILNGLKVRYDCGERNEELFNEIMESE